MKKNKLVKDEIILFTVNDLLNIASTNKTRTLDLQNIVEAAIQADLERRAKVQKEKESLHSTTMLKLIEHLLVVSTHCGFGCSDENPFSAPNGGSGNFDCTRCALLEISGSQNWPEKLKIELKLSLQY